jgi:methionyl-tRNA synthetase
VLLQPFLPFSSGKIFSWLSLKEDWTPQYVKSGTVLPEISILFERLDKGIVKQELHNLSA